MTHFPARFTTTCPACDDTIDRGTIATYDDGVVVHVACVMADDDHARPAPATCTRCHLVTPCWCEEGGAR